MKIRKVKVKNYRQFIEESFSLSDHISLIAGANNSGKTSLIKLIGDALTIGKNDYKISDLPIGNIREWGEAVFEVFEDVFRDTHTSKEEKLDSLVESLTIKNSGEFLAEYTIQPTSISMEISYESEDDIREFADFIIDLEAKKTFYFHYEIIPSFKTFLEEVEKNYKKLTYQFKKLYELQEVQEIADNQPVINSIKDFLFQIYESSFKERVFFCDSSYTNRIPMNMRTFKSLFNIEFIKAGRNLGYHNELGDDSISKKMVELASHDEKMKDLFLTLPDDILDSERKERIKSKMKNHSVNSLTSFLDGVSSVSSGKIGSLMIDILLNEEVIIQLITNITKTRYQYDQDHYLEEDSQGLGYSNMIFLLLQLETYKLKYDPLLINLFIIEEPEAHMHPQMQRVFGKYLNEYYKEAKIQGIITTHSKEMISLSDISDIKVIRKKEDKLISSIYDLANFEDEEDLTGSLTSLYFKIGFSDLVFADMAVLYEGDTERIYIQSLLDYDKFTELKKKYIAYIQVGGAYAHKYEKLINFLEVKTLIITDIDYERDICDEKEVLDSNISNETIKSFLRNCNPENKGSTVKEAYNVSNHMKNDYLMVVYQKEEDNYSRTLEEAMLAKVFGSSVFEKHTREDIQEKKKLTKLKFPVPIQEKGNRSIRDMVRSMENKKTDFMQSVILSEKSLELLPNYIKVGLEWLQK
jgi:predicted ATP-dependent endonuclease of OLD family